MEGESEDVRDLYITVFIVRNAIRIVWGEGRPLLMSSHEQRTHEGYMSIKLMRYGGFTRQYKQLNTNKIATVDFDQPLQNIIILLDFRLNLCAKCIRDRSGQG